MKRLLLHLSLIPLVSGVGYELIKIILKSELFVFRILKAPGIFLKNITTKEPDDKMIKVSITALKNLFVDEYNRFIGKKYKAEAIGWETS